MSHSRDNSPIERRSCPRLVVAGTAGDSGKTVVTLGLLAAWQQAGLCPAPFKKGPDYIDPAWLSRAAGHVCRNLDTYLQPAESLLGGFVAGASAGVSVIEGNRGLLDGMDVEGTHSTASLAQLLQAPVVLVVPVRKVTRTAAAVVAGCQQLAPQMQLAAVILNRVGGARHELLLRRSISELTGVEVVGALPELKEALLPERHLGLVPPEEHGGGQEALARIAEHVSRHVDLQRLLTLAQVAPPLELPGAERPSTAIPAGALASAVRPRIGVFSDSAFTFYYPENLEALERAGGELLFVSALESEALPEVDALYLGGGFPETHAPQLAAGAGLHAELRRLVAAGLPIYAECGGLIYLCSRLRAAGQDYQMAGVLPLELELTQRPQGHGYMEVEIETDTPFFSRGTRLRGHEFHYTRVIGGQQQVATAMRVLRGTGLGGGRDGVIYKNVLASYMHIHALGVPSWAPALVERAKFFAKLKLNQHLR